MQNLVSCAVFWRMAESLLRSMSLSETGVANLEDTVTEGCVSLALVVVGWSSLATLALLMVGTGSASGIVEWEESVRTAVAMKVAMYVQGNVTTRQDVDCIKNEASRFAPP